VTEVLSDFIVAEGVAHIQQEGRFPIDKFESVSFMYSL
jgi:hypothetical protein